MGKLTFHPLALGSIRLAGLMLSCLSLASGTEPPPPPVAPPPIEPSRYAGGDHFESYLQALHGILHATARTTDPFGLPQDPDANPVAKRSQRGGTPAEPTVPFSEIVPLIRITTVIASEKKFLVESRIFSQGEEFPLNFRGKRLRILITEVSARQVEFKNIETGEIAARKLDLLPPGMSSGGSGNAPPGMVPTGADAPLEIESDSGTNASLPAR